jgi:hypothetical protein
MHSDSVSSAFERRMAFSRIRERMTSASVGLGAQLGASGKACKVKIGAAYRPTSKAGDAIGENSVKIWKTPSNLRSGRGATTSTDILAMTLQIVSNRATSICCVHTWSFLAAHLLHHTHLQKLAPEVGMRQTRVHRVECVPVAPGE